MPSNPRDRTVHGLDIAMGDAWEIVRYDRAGKWYIEHPDGRRVRVGVNYAARAAAKGEAYLNRPGGQIFDARVRKINPSAGEHD
jgi:hypothetical protein